MIHWYTELTEKIRAFWQRIISSKSGTSDATELKRYITIDLDQVQQEERITFNIRNQAKMLSSYPDYEKHALELWKIAKTTDRPLLVTVMGEFKTGKSTFLNTLLGKEILKSDVTPATAVVTMLSYGEEESITAHFDDGTFKSYAPSELAGLTAEGNEEKKKIRNRIRYVEVKTPIELLKKITLVDTPGLNVDNSLHIEATKNFMYEADYVLWLFAYGKVASKTEETAIKDLGERLKPLAVVNRIDEMDEDEETLEDALHDITRRLKTSIRGVHGVSSMYAGKGLKSGNTAMIEESGWTFFMKRFNSDVLDKSHELLKSSIQSKLAERKKAIVHSAQTKREQLRTKKKELVNHTYTVEELGKRIDVLNVINQNIQLMIQTSKYIERTYIGDNLKRNAYEAFYPLSLLQKWQTELITLPDGSDVRDQVLLYEHMKQSIESRLQENSRKQEDLQNKGRKHRLRIRQWEQAIDTFNKSGFFGGRPLFDWGGEERRLKTEQNDINRSAEDIQTQEKRLVNEVVDLAKEAVTINKTIRKYLKKWMPILAKEIIAIEKKRTEMRIHHSSQLEQTEQELIRYEELITAFELPFATENTLLETTEAK